MRKKYEFLYQVIAFALTDRAFLALDPYITTERFKADQDTRDALAEFTRFLQDASEKRILPEPPTSKELAEMVEQTCSDAIRRIQAVLKDESLEDDECCVKIEEILDIFQSIGVDTGLRHDW